MTIKKDAPSIMPFAESIVLAEGSAPTAQLTQACTSAAMALLQMQTAVPEAPQTWGNAKSIRY